MLDKCEIIVYNVGRKVYIEIYIKPFASLD